MSTQITTAFVSQFEAGIRLLQQQMRFNFESGVMIDGSVTGDRAFYDQVDATNMAEVADRHGDTTYTDTPHRRRMVTPTAFDVADLIDNPDKVQVLNDPTNAYSRSFAAAANRQKDDTVIAAFFATAATGKTGTGTSAFDTTNYSIASGAAGMNLAKLTGAREILESAENMEEGDDYSWHIAMSASQREDLLQSTDEVKSSDYNTVRALVNGQINTYLGFNFVKSERLTTVGGERACPAWVKGSMQLALWSDARGYIDVLPGKRHSTQVRYTLQCGATRMDEKGVVRVLCTE